MKLSRWMMDLSCWMMAKPADEVESLDDGETY